MRRLLWICLFAPLLPSSAFGWGCDGHQIVALIARAHLTPATSAAVDDLLRTAPIDPALSRYCKSPDDLMADSSTWADDVRNQAKTGLWHYVDIPRSVTARTSLNPWCPPVGPTADGKSQNGCVTTALEFQLAILRDKSRPVGDRANALRYVIHFVGDSHQPLHAIDNYDQGGNCTTVKFKDDDRPSNLHSIWDSRFIQLKMTADKLTDTTYAAALNSRFAEKYAAMASAPVDDPATWSWETNEFARSVVYGNLDPSIPIEAGPETACATEREKVQALNIVIGDAYIAKATPVVDERLATAGFRLARLLNASL